MMFREPVFTDYDELGGLRIFWPKVYEDERGWLSELWRSDEKEFMDGYEPMVLPTMCYLSMTKPGVMRGPHEHTSQTDRFAFFDGNFILYIWAGCNERGFTHKKFNVGRRAPAIVEVPLGVVHAYKNIGPGTGLVVNLPDQLFKGWGKKGMIDEIRWEDDDEFMAEQVVKQTSLPLDL